MGNLQRAIILIAGTVSLGFSVLSSCAAKVVKLDVLRVESPAFEGRAFGPVGHV